MKALRFRFSTVVSVMVLATMLLVGCNKDEVSPSVSADALDAASASSLSEQTVVDLQTMSEEATGGSSLKGLVLGDSAIVPSRDRFLLKVADSTLIVIDFGVGTTCRDGKIRKGKVNVSRVRPPSKDREGGVITFSTDGYEVNGYKVNLTKTLTCLGWATDEVYTNGYLKYSVVVNNGLITRPNGDEVTVNISHIRKLVATVNSKAFVGWAVSGTSSHTVIKASSDKSFGVNTTITKDLLRPLKYHHFVAGEFVSEFLSGKTVTVNYGAGNLYDSTTWSFKKVITSDGSVVNGTQE